MNEGCDYNIVGGFGQQLLSNLFDQEIWTSVLYMAKTCCSIETEPKTLNEGLLNRARVNYLTFSHFVLGPLIAS